MLKEVKKYSVKYANIFKEKNIHTSMGTYTLDRIRVSKALKKRRANYIKSSFIVIDSLNIEKNL